MRNPVTRVVVADDHVMFGEMLREFLSRHFEVVRVVSDGQALLAATAELEPEIVIADIGMPRLNGLEAGRRLKDQHPCVKIIYITQNRDPDLAAEAFRTGASAFVVKTSAVSELIEAIHHVLDGRTYVSPLVADSLRQGFLEGEARSTSDPQLTARQREVLQLLAEGKSMKEVASILKISARTVQFHKYEAMNILHIRTNAEMVQYAIKHGMISL